MTRRIVVYHIPARRAVSKVSAVRTTDNLSLSKNFKYASSEELDLGKIGWGEVQYTVAVKVTIEASLVGLVGRNEWWNGTNYEDGQRVTIPIDAVKAALEKHLASARGREEVLDQMRDVL